MTSSQAARRLGLSKARVLQLCDEGALRYEPTPLGRLIAAESVEDLAKERAARL
jgi:hypothetical protein